MSEFKNEKDVSELTDGLYDGVLKRVYKNDLKTKPGYFLNLKLKIQDEDYTYGQFVSEKSLSFLYQNILLPLGMYCSEQGVLDCLNLRDLYIKFEKKSDERFTNIIIKPLFEYKDTAPVGSKNVCITPSNSSCNNPSTYVNDPTSFDMDDIPY